MSGRDYTLTGWKAWERRRRKELRFHISLNRASLTALHEVRCRARIAKIIGKPAAKALRLMVCQGGVYDPPMFLLVHHMDRETWVKLQHIPGLLCRLERPLPQ